MLRGHSVEFKDVEEIVELSMNVPTHCELVTVWNGDRYHGGLGLKHLLCSEKDLRRMTEGTGGEGGGKKREEAERERGGLGNGRDRGRGREEG